MKNSLNNDRDSKLDVYYSINSVLKPYLADDIPEFDRVVITRYRCGSHDLKIEKGRNEKGRQGNETMCMPSCTNVKTYGIGMATYKSYSRQQ